MIRQELVKQPPIDDFEKFDLPFRTSIRHNIEHDEALHDEIELVWVLQGAAMITCEKNTYELTKDTVFMIYMHQNHSIHLAPDAFVVAFHLKKDYMSQHHLYFARIPYQNRIYTFKELALKYPTVPLIISQLITLLETSESTTNMRYKIIGYYNMYIYDLYTVRMKDYFLDIKKRNYHDYIVRFNKILDHINNNYHHQISLSTLSTMVGISTFRLSHFLRDTLGIPFQEYLQNIRFEHALRELKNSNLSIQTIVRKCGFSDPKYLNALMKSRFHLTALQYRKIMKDNHLHYLNGDKYQSFLNELTFRLCDLDKESSQPSL